MDRCIFLYSYFTVIVVYTQKVQSVFMQRLLYVVSKFMENKIK